MKISTFAPAVVSFAALVTASVAVADIDLLSDADNGSKKGIQAVIEDDCEMVLDTVVYTKVGTIWVADEAETCVTEDAMLEEAPLKGELEMWSFFTVDCNGNGIPDSCDIASGFSTDCNSNGTIDYCDIAQGTEEDDNHDGIPDRCQHDCDHNGRDDDDDILLDPSRDCDSNGILDSCEIANGAQDKDHDGWLDWCEFAYGDLNLDGMVGPQDLTQVLSLWGFTTPGGYGDLNGDGIVGPQDLTIILSHWGASPYGGGGGDGDGHDH